MMNIAASTSVIVLLFGLFCITLQHKSTRCVQPIVCPRRNNVTIDLQNKAHMDAITLDFIEKLWASPFPKLTKKGLDFKKAVLYMAQSGVKRWEDVALMCSAWIWSALPQIDCKPNFCGFTQMINATLNTIDGKVNEKELTMAAESMSQSLMDASRFSTATALKNAGCTFEATKSTMPSCYKHGSAYNAHQFWNDYGYHFPCIFQKAAMNLYLSTGYANEYMAAVAAASATPHLGQFHNNFNFTLMYQVFNLQTTEKLPEYCCDILKADLEDTMSYAKPAAEYSKTQMLKAAGCNCEPVAIKNCNK